MKIVGDNMRVIISAGGTGGHIYPALAIADKIKQKDEELKSIIFNDNTDNLRPNQHPRSLKGY